MDDDTFYHRFLPSEKMCNCILKQIWVVQSRVRQYDWLAIKSEKVGWQMCKSFLIHTTGSPASSLGTGARATSQIQDHHLHLHLLWQWKFVSQLLFGFKPNLRKTSDYSYEEYMNGKCLHPSLENLSRKRDLFCPLCLCYISHQCLELLLSNILARNVYALP